MKKIQLQFADVLLVQVGCKGEYVESEDPGVEDDEFKILTLSGEETCVHIQCGWERGKAYFTTHSESPDGEEFQHWDYKTFEDAVARALLVIAERQREGTLV